MKGSNPQQHSVSGMFCPNCDGRIGVANICDNCGASAFNNWKTDPDYLAEQAESFAEEIRETVLELRADGLSDREISRCTGFTLAQVSAVKEGN